MAKIKLTKTELRIQELKLQQLKRYLPTLQLKKALLQMEVNNAKAELEEHMGQYVRRKKEIKKYAALFTDIEAVDLFASLEIEKKEVRHENIAGIDVSHLENLQFVKPTYRLFDAPLWMDFALEELQKLIMKKEKLVLIQEKIRLLDKDLIEVSIRVNLFEKIMIPRAVANIKKIKIFLSDQQLAAVAQAKVAKKKIQKKKEELFL